MLIIGTLSLNGIWTSLGNIPIEFGGSIAMIVIGGMGSVFTFVGWMSTLWDIKENCFVIPYYKIFDNWFMLCIICGLIFLLCICGIASLLGSVPMFIIGILSLFGIWTWFGHIPIEFGWSIVMVVIGGIGSLVFLFMCLNSEKSVSSVMKITTVTIEKSSKNG